MPVADERWGAELVTRRGVVRKYDAVECLARDIADGTIAQADIGSVWVVPFDAPGTLVPAEDAVYVRSAARRSPMGLDLTAFAPGANLAALGVRDGVVLDWDGVRELVATAASAPGHMHGSGVD
jgi:copper chaperone NosL